MSGGDDGELRSWPGAAAELLVLHVGDADGKESKEALVWGTDGAVAAHSDCVTVPGCLLKCRCLGSPPDFWFWGSGVDSGICILVRWLKRFLIVRFKKDHSWDALVRARVDKLQPAPPVSRK